MSLFDFDQPDRYAVMGNPIAHSKSPAIHTMFAAQTGQRMEYTAIQVDPGGFAQAVRQFVANGGKGLNITVPFKQEAWRLVDVRTPRAERAGAVNTIVVQRDNRLLGDNTDGIGLVRDLVQNHVVQLSNKAILLMGAGGAARGVLAPLLEQRPAQFMVANRTVDKALALAQEFGVRGCAYEGLGVESFDLIINATAASLHGELPALPDGVLQQGGVCYDMMYGAQATPFMQWAQQHGAARVIDGLGMLVEQAAEAFSAWRGVMPDTAAVISALRRNMTSGGK